MKKNQFKGSIGEISNTAIWQGSSVSLGVDVLYSVVAASNYSTFADTLAHSKRASAKQLGAEVREQIAGVLSSTGKIELGDDPLVAAAHMGGSWNLFYDWDKTGQSQTVTVHDDYINFLKDLNVDTVGFSISVFLDGDSDSSVEFVFQNDWDHGSHTITDENFFYLMQRLQDAGINTYLTVAFEDLPSGTSPHRWLLGSDYTLAEDYVDEEDWAWDPDHPDHESFIAEFWQSYAARMERISSLAEQAGVEMLSIGTEVEGIMTTEANAQFPVNFQTQIQDVIDQVRKDFSGMVTYNQYFGALKDQSWFASEDIWNDTDLDGIGISAYFPLLQSVTGVSSVATLEAAWRLVFETYLLPLQEENPGKPIFFTEFGYTDSVNSPVSPSSNEFDTDVFDDNDNNGLDDGEETQSNIYQAFFNVNREYDSLVRAVYLWDVGEKTWSDETQSQSNYGVSFSIRDKLAASVVANEYYVRSFGIEGQIEIVDGDESNETFDEGSGRQLYKGGTGNDKYVIDNTEDLIWELDEGGTDTAEVAIQINRHTYVMSDFVENAVLVGSFSLNVKGNALNNAIMGNKGANILLGQDGADTIKGGSGADVILGGAGKDILSGQAGADIFSYQAAIESGKGSKADRITDFKRGEDIIDLELVDANLKKSGDQDFTFIGSKDFVGKAGQLRFEKGNLFGDIDGDGKADLQIVLAGVKQLGVDAFDL